MTGQQTNRLPLARWIYTLNKECNEYVYSFDLFIVCLCQGVRLILFDKTWIYVVCFCKAFSLFYHIVKFFLCNLGQDFGKLVFNRCSCTRVIKSTVSGKVNKSTHS